LQKARYFIPRTRTRVDWYELFYLEKPGYILVFRDEDVKKHRYLVRVRKVEAEVFLDCPCLGAINHGHCQHEDHSRKYFNFNKTRNPRRFDLKTQEEYLTNYLQNHLKDMQRKGARPC